MLPRQSAATVMAGALVGAALALLGPTQSDAAGVATFRLTNIDLPGSAPVTSVVAQIIPPGSVVPRNVVTDPPTILPESSGYISSGFNQDDLQFVLGDGTTPDGEPFQALKLDFGPEGLAPGGKLFFQLNKSPSFDGLVRLILPSSVTNLALERLDPDPVPVPPTPTDGGTTVPEPMSLMLWAGLTLLGVWRARLYRLRHAPLA